MIALVLLLLAAEPAPECAADADCVVTTVGNCCDCCPVAPRAAPKKTEETRCRGIACPARACPQAACKKVSTAGVTAVCREARCSLEKRP